MVSPWKLHQQAITLNGMKRRSFMQMIGAALTLPMMPTSALAAAKPAAVAVPSQARYWAVYMNSLHGECTPRALQTMLNVPAETAKSYLNQLVADGVVKAHPMAKMMVQNQSPGSNLMEDIKTKVKDRLRAVAEEDISEDQADPDLTDTEVVEVETEATAQDKA